MLSKRKGMLLTILSAVTFGFAFTLGPMTYGVGGSNALTLTFLRNALCLPVLYLILKSQKIALKITKNQLKHLILLSVIGTAVTTLMLNMSYVFVDVGIATTIHFVYPVFVTLGCAIFFHEKLTKTKCIALSIATLGILCFFFAGGSGVSSNFPLGIFLAVASGVTYAFYIIYMDKSGLKDNHPFKISFYVASISSVVLLIFGLVFKALSIPALSNLELTLETLTPTSWIISFVFAILCTVVALSLLQVGIKSVGSSTAAILSTFEPITSVIMGAILLGEQITMMKVGACVLIIIGVMILSLGKEKKVVNNLATAS